MPGREDLVREMAARTIVAALFVGAIGDPDRPGARRLRPSMVTWFSDEALELESDADARRAWHAAASQGRRSVTAFLATNAIPHNPWYADNTREPIRDEILRPLREQFGAVLLRSGAAPTAPAPSMTLDVDFAALFDPGLMEPDLGAAIATWGSAHLGQAERLRVRALARLMGGPSEVRVSLPGRGERVLPAGESSALTRSVVDDFVPRFVEVNDTRRAALLEWATGHGLKATDCRFLTVFRSRSAPVARRLLPRVAWGTDVWFADEPDHLLRLE